MGLTLLNPFPCISLTFRAPMHAMATDQNMSSWTDLLNSSTKLLEEAAPSAGFPPLQRNLDQLETLSKKLMAKTLRNRAPQQSIATTRLLAREGLNTEQLARDLNSFELKAVEPQTVVSYNLATLTTNSNPVAVATSTVSTAPSSSIHSVADKLKALMEPPALPAKAVRAKTFLANLDQVDLEAEGSEQALWDSIEALKPYATPKELELLSQIEFLTAQIPSRLAGLEEQKITVREQQQAFSQLDQSFHSEHSHLTNHFNTAVVEADLKLSRLERQKAEIEAEIEATRLARDEQLALTNQQLNELQKRKAALDQASSKAKIAEGHLRLIRADLNQLKLELDVQGKLL